MQYLNTEQQKIKSGNGRKAVIATNENKQKIKKFFEHKNDINQNDAAEKFNCCQQCMSINFKFRWYLSLEKGKSSSLYAEA